MKFFIILVLLSLSLLIVSCGDDSENTTEQTLKEFDVEYTVTTSSGNISDVRYLTKSGDTLSTSNIPSFNYKWQTKGKSGEHTYLLVRLTNTKAKAYLKILANNNPIISDSLAGGGTGSTATIERGITLPY